MSNSQLLLQDESGENERAGGTGGGDRTDYGYGTYLQGSIEGDYEGLLYGPIASRASILATRSVMRFLRDFSAALRMSNFPSFSAH